MIKFDEFIINYEINFLVLFFRCIQLDINIKLQIHFCKIEFELKFLMN